MATETTTVHPGDIVQDARGLIFLVSETHRWGVGALLKTETGDSYHRLKPGQFVVVGQAHTMNPDIAGRRRDSLAAAAEAAGPDGQKIVMILRDGPPQFRGQFLREFDHEADDGRGEIEVTQDLALAMRFPDLAAAIEFRNRVPRCKPTREDGQPNRPLSATTWEFTKVEEAGK